ncbi:MAG TPA: T9SS type A sorting domain-containing protein, partial [Bacteroidia bacterium]|nr:T9SS type A sorting domain-containing protein [Bacteroidia bacterium]
WDMDSCNNGAQRSADKFWKSNTGGTTPSGNDFWHRNDYTGSDWTSPTGGMYTPAASNGSFSARFHNDPSPAGSTGQMDLYLNLSNPGSKTIQFDYIHNEASPSPFAFDVLLSTDGGITFPTNLLTITSAQVSAWATQTLVTSATSPTSVLRFSVTDKGSQDVGVDNIHVTLGTLTGINTLAGENRFSLFPNPSDGTLINGFIPDPDSHNLEIRIYNAVGREVLVRQLQADGGNFSLPLNRELSSGLYLFVARSGDKQYSRKMVIQ